MNNLKRDNPILNLMLKNGQQVVNSHANEGGSENFLRIAPTMNYEEAQQQIHKFILDMDI